MKPIDNLSSQFNFREANPQDIGEIIGIHNSHVRELNALNSHGFLLAATTEQEIIEKINHQTQYFVAVHQDLEKNNKVLGFLALSKPKISPEFLSQIIWKDDSCQNKILSDQHLYINIVATHPEHMSKGVAQFLYKSLYKTFPNAFFSTFIVSQPISNSRSILFHEKQGFYWVGTLKRESFLEFKNYESVLMVKEI
ncbi:acetyltransferase family protein [Lyngbya aestuarii BL J]|uniref:Acetyltransferase family protein n=1 Tax=Lyngbya aestuarii BL J TaxID=1348334 RepID=U7QAJ5_9CYAN|nr:GNAT family N-acetyltransferase [Lyngbya aestuarii]ERT04212.1 acetyltransferase family protein [Lyngbya aestuarii BL J]